MVHFLKESSGYVGGLFSWGQAIGMSFGVFKNKIMKEGTSFSSKFSSFSTK